MTKEQQATVIAKTAMDALRDLRLPCIMWIGLPATQRCVHMAGGLADPLNRAAAVASMRETIKILERENLS